MNLTGNERRTILVVDGNDTFFRHAETALRQADARLCSLQQPDGRQALDFLLRCRPGGIPVPAAVLVDRRLPGDLDGYAVIRMLRGLEGLASVPVFLCHGSDDAEHIIRGMEAGATGCLQKPVVTDGFPDFARQVCARLEECWREFGGPLAEGSLAVREAALQSRPTRAIIPAAPAIPTHTVPASGAADENAFLRTFVAIRDLIVKTIDPVEYAINEACRKHHIPVSHARGRGGDYITVRNRHRVILDVMDTGFGDRVISENFLVSQRDLERLRKEWRDRNDGGSLAVA